MTDMNSRMIQIDCIRAVAIILIVCLHTRLFFFDPSKDLMFLSFFNVIGFVGVPLFIITSGFLLLDRDYSDTNHLNRYAKRNLLPLFISFEIWNFLWLILDSIGFLQYPGGGFPLDIVRVLKTALFIGDTGSALWYMPMIIGVYIGVPIIAVFLHSIESKKYFWFILILAVYFGIVVPTANNILGLLGHQDAIHSVLNMNLFGATVWGDSVWMVYLVTGYIVKTGRLSEIRTWIVFIVWILSGALSFYFCQNGISNSVETMCNYSNIFIVVLSISSFLLLFRVGERIMKIKPLATTITTIGRYSFSIYMMHLFVIGASFHILDRYTDRPYGVELSESVHFLVFVLFVLAVIILSMMIALVISRSNYLRKWLLLLKDSQKS